jgi:hypothetical protein
VSLTPAKSLSAVIFDTGEQSENFLVLSVSAILEHRKQMYNKE